jgi:hypothetical protein
MMNHAKLFPVSVAFSALASAALATDEPTTICVELGMVRYPPYPTYFPDALSQSSIGGLGSMYIPTVTPRTPKVVSSRCISVPFQISVSFLSVVCQPKTTTGVEAEPEETGRALSGVTVIGGPIVQLPLAKAEIGAYTLIVNGVLSAIESPVSVTFRDTGRTGVMGTDGGSMNCIHEEYEMGVMAGGELKPTYSKNEEIQETKLGFVSAPTTNEPIDANQKITARSKRRRARFVLNASYCCVLNYSPSTVLTVSDTEREELG